MKKKGLGPAAPSCSTPFLRPALLRCECSTCSTSMSYRWMSFSSRVLGGRKNGRVYVAKSRGSSANVSSCSPITGYSTHECTTRKLTRSASSNNAATIAPATMMQPGSNFSRGWAVATWQCFSGGHAIVCTKRGKDAGDLNLEPKVKHAAGSRRWFSSKSADTLGTTAPKTGDEAAEVEGEEVPGDEENVSPNVATPMEPRHHHITVPDINQGDDLGAVTCWNVSAGDRVEVGDVVCEIELEQFSVGVKVETSGYIAEILMEAGSEKIRHGTPIATVVHSQEDIAVYQKAQDALEEVQQEREHLAKEADELTFSWKDVLKTVSKLAEETKLSEDDASMLMSLSRHKDSDLMLAFDGCFEGTEYQGELDEELFLLQARDIVRIRRKAPEQAKATHPPEHRDPRPGDSK